MTDENKTEILIVEDSPTQALELQYMLVKNGYTVFTAYNGAEALSFIERHKPLIVISDIIMPEMDGYELCSCIKHNESLQDIFVILLTSLSKTEDVVKSLQCGADKFFTKPYDEKLLLSAIEGLTRNIRLPGNEERQQAVEFFYGGQKYSINTDRGQIINLLISTYEAAVKKSDELMQAQDELQRLNKYLEDKVEERTADLKKKNEELNIISQQLWQAAKLATMGELAASIAHELNNPLATVGLRVESLSAKTTEGSPQRHEIEVIEGELERMGSLIANLLQFSRRGKRMVSTVDVRDEIEKTLELIHYHLRKYGINVVKDLTTEPSYIHADRQQLRQVFLNLFTNAADAMPRGGTLAIHVSTKDSKLKGEASVVIEITDTGAGIPVEYISKVTEPFFTTKTEGKGTGLGLAICKRIVREHDGTFEIINRPVPENGALIRITLPSSKNSNSSTGNISALLLEEDEQ